MRQLPLALLIACVTPDVSDTDSELVLTGDVTITTDLEVNALRGVSVIDGSLHIYGDELDNVDSLYALREVTGTVAVRWTRLTDVHGLSGLNHVGGYLWLLHNDRMVELGLEPMTVGASLAIDHNGRLCQSEVDAFVCSVTGGDPRYRRTEPNDPEC